MTRWPSSALRGPPPLPHHPLPEPCLSFPRIASPAAPGRRRGWPKLPGATAGKRPLSIHLRPPVLSTHSPSHSWRGAPSPCLRAGEGAAVGRFQELQPRPGEAPSSGWGCCQCKSWSGGKALGRNGIGGGMGNGMCCSPLLGAQLFILISSVSCSPVLI